MRETATGQVWRRRSDPSATVRIVRTIGNERTGRIVYQGRRRTDTNARRFLETFEPLLSTDPIAMTVEALDDRFNGDGSLTPPLAVRVGFAFFRLAGLSWHENEGRYHVYVGRPYPGGRSSRGGVYTLAPGREVEVLLPCHRESSDS